MYGQRLTPAARRRLWLRLGLRFVLAAVCVVLVWTLGRPLLALFMPFLLAWGAAVLLDGPVRRLHRRLGWSRGVLSLLTMLVLFGALSTGVGLLVRGAVREVVSLAENWDSLLAAAREVLVRLEGHARRVSAQLPFEVLAPDQSLAERLGAWLGGITPDWGNLTSFATDKARALSSFVLGLVFFLMGTYFLCADYPYLRTRLMGRMGEGTQSLLRQVKAAVAAAFGGYLKAQVLLSVAVFFLLLCGFVVTGQDYALLLALGLAVLDFIPLLGAGTVMIPWAVVELIAGHYSRAVAVMVIWGVVALFRRVAEPKFVGDRTGLSPIVSLVSIYVGMKLAGVAGMILGPVVTLVALNLLGLGLLDGWRADVRLAVRDMAGLLRSPPEEDR
ncbi:MAG: sporulation integral membrane protein YtvI [Oscillospiraceae bacterium]|nr:sporulation integral membrane protein YtvI [Oscillospiraceae bacterium]